MHAIRRNRHNLRRLTLSVAAIFAFSACADDEETPRPVSGVIVPAEPTPSLTLTTSGVTAPADGVGTIVLTARAELDGEAIADGTPVTFTTDLGTFVGGTETLESTFTAGEASATISSTVIGIATIDVDALGRTRTATLEFFDPATDGTGGGGGGTGGDGTTGSDATFTGTLLLTATPSTVSQGLENTVTLSGWAIATGNVAPESGLAVTFSVESGPGGDPGLWGLVDAEASVGPDGSFDATYRAAPVTGTVVIKAWLGTAGRTVSITVDAGSTGGTSGVGTDAEFYGSLLLAAVPATTRSGLDNTVTLSGWAIDLGSVAPEAGLSVTFSVESGPGIDPGLWGLVDAEASIDADGSFEATYRAAPITGTVTLKAWLGTASQTVVVTIDDTTPVERSGVGTDSNFAGSLLLAADPSTTKSGLDKIVSLSGWAIDIGNVAPEAGQAVTFSIESGPGIDPGLWGLVDSIATVAADGSFEAEYRAAPVTGTVVIKVWLGTATQTVSITIDDTAVADPSGVGTDSTFAGSLILEASPLTSAPGMNNAVALSGWAVDVGNVAPEAGQAVTFSIESGPGIDPGLWGLVESTASLAADGSFDAEYLAAPVTGTVVIKVWLGSASQTVSVTIQGAPVSEKSGVGTDSDFAGGLLLEADPATTRSGLDNVVTLSGWAVDVGNVAPEAGQAVTFSVESGPGIDPNLWGIVDSSANVAADGSFEAEYRAAPVTGTVVIKVWLGSASQTVSVTVDDTAVADPSGVGTDSDFAGGLLMEADPSTTGSGLDKIVSLSGWAIDIGNVAPEAGQAVTFSIESGPGIDPNLWGIVDSSANVAANGSFEAEYRAAPVTGTVVIKVWLGSASQTVSITVDDTAVVDPSGVGTDSDFAGTLILDAIPSTVTVGLENIVDISGWAVDVGNVAPEAGQAVTFSIESGPGIDPGLWGLVDSMSSVAADGSFAAEYRAAEVTGTVVVKAWLGNSSQTISITVEAGASGGPGGPSGVGTDSDFAGTLLIEATPSTTESGLEHVVALSGWAVDVGNVAPEAGQAVTFSIESGPGMDPGLWGLVDSVASIAADGSFNAEYRAAEVTGAVVIKVWLGAASQTVSVTIDDAAVVDPTGIGTDASFAGTLLLSATPDTVEPGADNSVELDGWAIDVGNVPPSAGLAVTFSIESGPGIDPGLWGIVQPQASVGADGSFSATYRAAEVTGAVTIKAWLGSSSQTVVVTIDNTVVSEPSGEGTDSDFAGTLLLGASPLRVALGLDNTVALTGWAVAPGNVAPPAGQAVTFSVDNGPGLNPGLWGIVDARATVGANGSFTATYRAATLAGTVDVTAWLGSATTTVTLTVADRSPATFLMTASPSSLDADGSSESEVTVLVLDSSGQTVPDGTTIEFSVQSGGGTINPASVQTSGGRVATTYRAGTTGGTAIVEASAVNAAGTTIAQTLPISLIDRSPATVQVSVDPASIEQGQSADVSVRVLDGNSNPVQAGTAVTLTTIGGDGTFTSPSIDTDADGRAATTFYSGTVTGTALVVAWSGGVSGTTLISVVQPATGSIQFVEADPTVIGVKGSSGSGNSTVPELSKVTFQVLTSSGLPVPDGTLVTFALSAPIGTKLQQTSSTTVDGIARTNLTSGTVSGIARVRATTQYGSNTFVAYSQNIVIQAGPPVDTHISVGIEDAAFKVQGMSVNGIEQFIGIYASDRYRNPVPDGTRFYLTAEGGLIDPVVETVNGYAKATLRSAPAPVSWDNTPSAQVSFPSTLPHTWNPVFTRPANRMVSVMIQTAGEELFTDLNGNGRHDAGEPFRDIAEPFLDLNENGVWDFEVVDYSLDAAGYPRVEPFWESFAVDATWTAPNGVYDASATVSSNYHLIWVDRVLNVQWLPGNFYDFAGDGYTPGTDVMLLSASNAITSTVLEFCVGVTAPSGPATVYTAGPFVDLWVGDSEGVYPFNEGTITIDVPSGLEALPDDIRTVPGDFLDQPLISRIGFGFSGTVQLKQSAALKFEFPDGSERIITNVCIAE